MYQICASVITEQGAISDLNFYTFSTATGTAPKSISTRAAVISIRPKALLGTSVNRALILLEQINIATSTRDVFYEVVIGGALGGSPSWASVDANSAVEVDIAGTTVTGGITVDSGFAVAGTGTSRATLSDQILSSLPITLDIDGANPVIVSIVATAFSPTASVSVAMNWKEIY